MEKWGRDLWLIVALPARNLSLSQDQLGRPD
jgi:hypothetical protein